MAELGGLPFCLQVCTILHMELYRSQRTHCSRWGGKPTRQKSGLCWFLSIATDTQSFVCNPTPLSLIISNPFNLSSFPYLQVGVMARVCVLNSAVRTQHLAEPGHLPQDPEDRHCIRLHERGVQFRQAEFSRHGHQNVGGRDSLDKVGGGIQRLILC